LAPGKRGPGMPVVGGPGRQGAEQRVGVAGRAQAAVKKGAKFGLWAPETGRRKASGAWATAAEGRWRAGRRGLAGETRAARG
jgi:hypothetical protein